MIPGLSQSSYGLADPSLYLSNLCYIRAMLIAAAKTQYCIFQQFVSCEPHPQIQHLSYLATSFSVVGNTTAQTCKFQEKRFILAHLSCPKSKRPHLVMSFLLLKPSETFRYHMAKARERNTEET